MDSILEMFAFLAAWLTNLPAVRVHMRLQYLIYITITTAISRTRRSRDPPAKDNVCHLFRLPPELRHQIWIYLTPPNYTKEIRRLGDPPPRMHRVFASFTRLFCGSDRRASFAILATNRQIYNEVSGLLYSSLTLNLDIECLDSLLFIDILPMPYSTFECAMNVNFHVHFKYPCDAKTACQRIKDRVYRAQSLFERMPNLQTLKMKFTSRPERYDLFSTKATRYRNNDFGRAWERVLEPLAKIRGLRNVEVVWSSGTKGTLEYAEYLINEMTRPRPKRELVPGHWFPRHPDETRSFLANPYNAHLHWTSESRSEDLRSIPYHFSDDYLG
ncbi:MAG: hypothetical protein M1812_007107 [Candelaria pacifica]|nr:MAG: hypothetical protein M1812_007107 [Candelaria pacifica]